MARLWTLNGTTIPNPHGYRKEAVETSASHVGVTGKTFKQITNIKYRHILRYKFLTQAQVASLRSLYNLQTTMPFTATDGSLTISSVDVHMELAEENFPYKGSEFREEVVVVLTEEQ